VVHLSSGEERMAVQSSRWKAPSYRLADATSIMQEDLKQFEAVFAAWEGLDCSLVTIEFRVEDEGTAD